MATDLTNAFLNGVSFIDLSQARDSESFVAALAQLLAIKEEAGQSLLERVIATLRSLHILLVLDNFEQLINARTVLADLLATCDRLQVLVTSRILLHVQAERILEVPPLALPDIREPLDPSTLLRNEAISLFVQRAQAMQPDFALTQVNAPFVANICTHLDGIPLAIELAAARSRYFSPQALLGQIEAGLQVLSKKAPDIPPRQQTLRGAIAWSYELLSEEERRVFRRLAVCVHGCTAEAAEQVCGLPDSALEVLETLVDQSMLRIQGRDEREPRFTLLQTLREYGLERLGEAGEEEATRAAHALYYLSWAQQAAAFSNGAQQAEWLDRQEQEYENLRAALEWMLRQDEKQWGEKALLLCVAMINFWEIRGPFSEGAAFLQRALAVSAFAEPTLRAEALQRAAYLALIMDDAARAEQLLQESQILFRSSRDQTGMANILRMQGSLAWARSNYKLARRLLEEALTLYRGLGNRRGVISTRNSLAQVAIIQCNFQQARTMLEENIAYHEAWDEEYQTAQPLYHLARVLFLSKSSQQQARRLAEQGLTLFKQVRNARLVAYTLCLLAQISLVENDIKPIETLLAEASRSFEEVGDRYGSALALTVGAALAIELGEWEPALARYERSWQLLREIDAKDAEPVCLEGAGEALLALGEPTSAVSLWAQAALLRAELVAPLPPVDRSRYERAVSAAREQLGREAFRAAWDKGRQRWESVSTNGRL